MDGRGLPHDPYNLIVAGVGGQGNVMTSRTIGSMLAAQGFFVTIGETFGASQRGGSVMSHLRISARCSWSPQIPLGKAHMVVSMEPSEAIRVLKDFGNRQVKVITNTRPFLPVGVISGQLSYPSDEEIRGWILEMTEGAWFLNATEEAVKIGAPVLGNVIMAGALAGTGELPLARELFEGAAEKRFDGETLAQNLTAFDVGVAAVSG
ncbi:indolepyruvate oxidoreductase subunit beta [Desulfoluna butyratoxydans]|uniref:Pyruvate ferredoxin/flavodoxin oxidoreductase n=1 Tax=Desulfoluna butyratoxydans TaxID=231438 RepID=A0A4U8YK85_9BACT|nr:indolepyruvate oxidoreductase subunit beta [Desulfoluna butyratoxydans]VFQ43509.1 pyruvate ferredoxin/flavodoxin oxidoreductase [Desulfoluna butyratoxydans]